MRSTTLTLGGVLWLGLVAGCATTRGERGARAAHGASIEALAEELAHEAGLRADLSAMRVEVSEVAARELPATEAWRRVGRGPAFEDLAEELRRELVLALSGRMHVLDLDYEPDGAARASHVALAEFEGDPEGLRLEVRLVDLHSKLIVAAARDLIPLAQLPSRARAALAPGPFPVSPDVARAVQPAPAPASPPPALDSESVRSAELNEVPGGLPRADSTEGPSQAALVQSTSAIPRLEDVPIEAPTRADPLEPWRSVRSAGSGSRSRAVAQEQAAPAPPAAPGGPAALRMRRLGRELAPEPETKPKPDGGD